MKIAYGSDLHLELGIAESELDSIRGADILILAGDIYKGRNEISGRPKIMEYSQQCIKELAIPVIVVCGNHELYGEEAYRFWNDCQNFSAATQNLHFLENETLILNGHRFLGCTLWSDFQMMGNPEPAMELAQQIIYDYKRVKLAEPNGEMRDLVPDDTRKWNANSRQFLEKSLAESFDGQTVVVSHFPPVPMSAPEFAESPLTPYFNNNWADDITNGILTPDIWISGHTHHMEEKSLGTTRIRSRQGGYPGELGPFKWGVVET